MRHSMMMSHYNDNDLACLSKCSCSFLILPTGCYRVYEIKLSHMGKNSRNSDLACEKYQYLMNWTVSDSGYRRDRTTDGCCSTDPDWRYLSE